jgi:hypothetical protein
MMGGAYYNCSVNLPQGDHPATGFGGQMYREETAVSDINDMFNY